MSLMPSMIGSPGDDGIVALKQDLRVRAEASAHVDV
jgi:hypothetical protein